MFERNKDKDKQAVRETPAQPPSESTPPGNQGYMNSRSAAMIGPGIRIKGDVTGEEDLVIKGKVEGTIDLGGNEVTVSESGEVKADIKAKVVVISGEVTGDVSGSEKVIISKSGNVRGNIIAPRMTLEDGAVFKGSIDMDPGDVGKSKGPSAAPQPKPVSSVASEKPALDIKSG
jgi:cytoskeletal protein CcmA (bactofilin family)